MKYYQY